jgi:hypothetical protein
MQTIAYIDGFNFYYGAVKGTGYKWIDFRSLLRKTLPEECSVHAIKYFTAMVKPLEWNSTAPARQKIYLKALRAFIPEIEIKLG